MTATPRITSRGWLAQARAGLPDAQALTVVAVVGTVIAAAIAALAFGDTALHVVLVAVLAWLMWDRVTLLDRCDEATDTADRALSAMRGLADDTAPTGRHARRQQ